MSESTEYSLRSLLLAIGLAIVLAVGLALSFVLPAEFGIDPTGIGSKLGLTRLSNTGMAVDASAVTTGDEAANVGTVSAEASTDKERADEETSKTKHVVQIVVPPGKGVEYKFNMQQYQKMHYEWLSDGAALYFDLHGEPAGDTTGYFESYTIATADEMKGSFTAPFDGSHGWYWKNKSTEAVSVRLQVSGSFTVIGLKK